MPNEIDLQAELDELKSELADIKLHLKEQKQASLTVTWPLLALVEHWRMEQERLMRRANEYMDDQEKQYRFQEKAQAYRTAADQLERWINSGTLPLDLSPVRSINRAEKEASTYYDTWDKKGVIAEFREDSREVVEAWRAWARSTRHPKGGD